MYLVSHRNSSSKDGAVLNVVNQEAGVVKHLDDVANLANLKNNIQWESEYRTSLVFEWLKVDQLLNGPLFKCHLNTKLNLVWYSDPHLNTGFYLNGGLNTNYHFVKYVA